MPGPNYIKSSLRIFGWMLLIVVVSIPVLVSLFFYIIGTVLSGFDLNSGDMVFGEGARVKILERSHQDLKTIPGSALNFCYFEGGNFSGSIDYWAFDCTSAEDCFRALEALTGVSKSQMAPWKPSKYAVVMLGPGFYSDQWTTDLWDVRRIVNGVFLEDVHSNGSSMDYYAIDLDRLRVFFHHESGGFPTDEYPLKPQAIPAR